jgi:predicted acylesterase/phospholipase RssA
MIMRHLATCLAIVLLAACASGVPPRVAPDASVYESVAIAGIPDARYWGDNLDSETARREASALAERAQMRWREAGAPAEGLDTQILALSGGGPDGAFAAGLLSGWSTTGLRPEFELVTGVSVGALIAPFVFLGPDYDSALRMIFTEFGTDDVAILRPFAALFGALGLADTTPLRRTIRSLVDEPMLVQMAEEHARGRRLLIGTTNIDAGRSVIWNMGAIAAAGERELFADVMLASASIPGAFPPVSIEVEAEGRTYSEFHVDGGVTHSVILWPAGTEDLLPRIEGIQRHGTIYVIQNNQLLPPFQPVEPRLTSIATRSLSTLIRGQTEGDLARIYRAANNIGYDFRLVFVPSNPAAPGTTDFDPAYMTSLFETAFTIGSGDIPWLSQPPGVLSRSEIVALVSQIAGQ